MPRRLRLAALTVSSIIVLAGRAAAQDQPPRPSPLVEDAGFLLSDFSTYFTSPLHFSGPEWMVTGGVLSATVLLMTADAGVRDAVSMSGNGDYNGDFWDAPTFYGSTLFTVPTSLLVYAGGLATHCEPVRTTGRLMLTALVSSGAVVTLLKYTLGRDRPWTGSGPWSYRGLQWEDAHHSFPSGHTAAAFAVSTVLAERIDRTWARVLFYGLGALTGFARVRNDQHWASDAFLGMAIGVTAGLHAIWCEERRAAAPPGATGAGLRLEVSASALRFSYGF